MTDILFGVKDIDELIGRVRENSGLREEILNLEDSVGKIFSIDRKSSVLDINFPLLWEAPKSRIFSGNIVGDIPIDIGRYNGFVIGGRILRCVTDCVAVDDRFNIFFYELGTQQKFVEMILGGGVTFELIEKDDEKYHVRLGEYHINVYYGKIFGSVMEILLGVGKYIGRFCFDCKVGKFIGSAMFYLELDRLVSASWPVSMVGCVKKRDLIGVHKFVEAVDFDGLMNYGGIGGEYEVIDSEGYTALERALMLYAGLKNAVLRNNLENIIRILSGYVYFRPPDVFWRWYFSRGEESLKLCDTIFSIKNKFGLVGGSIGDCDGGGDDVLGRVNTYVIGKLLEGGQWDNIIEYLGFIGGKNFDHNVFVNVNDKDGLRGFIPKLFKELKTEVVSEIVLMTEMIDLFEKFQVHSTAFLKRVVVELVKNFKFVSLVYLSKMGYDIFRGEYERPLLFYVLDGHVDKILRMMQFLRKYGGGENIEGVDGFGDTWLHVVVNRGDVRVVRAILEGFSDKSFLNKTNKKGMSILHLAAVGGNEELYLLLRLYGCDDMLRDELGNTVYHYIVMNKMFIGSVVWESENSYGFRPSYYTFLKGYWKFKDYSCR
ncbi:MAG: ankyrin repeat protein [Hyperionvirus sp.]|uniref:Ankyrin repeat protein n=1 Tax=Hyperionvirus sp. TaxID=2487770 RepID=A0A3G5ABM1_9VIRU|nr:MAG: ankyrin repeat protein [Hyperionvirus sp.]